MTKKFLVITLGVLSVLGVGVFALSQEAQAADCSRVANRYWLFPATPAAQAAFPKQCVLSVCKTVGSATAVSSGGVTAAYGVVAGLPAGSSGACPASVENGVWQ